MCEVYTRFCRDCGTKFKTEKPAAQYCLKCLKEHKRDNWKRNQESYKKPIAENPKPVQDDINGNDKVKNMNRLCELYNQNHGTKYSYGQFVSGLHTGKIKIGVVKNE